MKLWRRVLILTCIGSLTSCSWFTGNLTEKSPAPTATTTPVTPSAISNIPRPPQTLVKDRTLEIFAKHFEQADAVHREAWWVLTGERRPSGKSPFGKVQRAILSSQNIALANKSAFRCDRYIFRRDVMGPKGFPQKGEIFEKCSEKLEAKKIAEFFATSASDIQVTFFSENLEEILGLGATVLNLSIKCTIKGNESEQLDQVTCLDWAQDRNKDQMIRLDEYDYKRSGKNLIRLRGKVYENLTDTRKIEAEVPMEGKIVVKEVELYPPEPSPIPVGTATPSPTPQAQKPRPAHAPPLTLPPEGGAQHQVSPIQPQPVPGEMSTIPVPGAPGIPPARQSGPMDPDVMMMQQQQSAPDAETVPPQGEAPAAEGSSEEEEMQMQNDIEEPSQNPETPSGEAHGR